MATKQEKLAALEELSEAHHCFLTVEGAKHYGALFGFEPRTYVAHANPSDPKGLTLDNGAESAEGIAAERLAMQICDHLKAPYPSMMGRGFQLRVCIEAATKAVEALAE